ncbi:GAF domain-containing protein [bacterium]|nr:MAG: GAF domain-containing protein [bacterium]
MPLLDLLPDQDPRLHPRNRCIHEGFHSVALIPIRANQEIVGLLQLNDRKKGCFTLDMINFFEGLGLSIGIALTRQQAEEAVKERTSQLESVNKELESFSYSISHDLRAPLRAINGFSRMLARDLKDKLDEESMHRLDTIRENGIKMNQLIDDVLTFSRLGNESLAMTVIDMADLATDVWNELQENNPQRNISINVAHPMACYGDQKMMRRVLTNLLSNAAKFTTERQTATIKVGSYENEDEYVYYVKDNGSGFDMQYSDKLFRLFQRLHSDADYEGTGAGLSIVKRIVERHGGRVWAEGKVNEGATFYFSLPK